MAITSVLIRDELQEPLEHVASELRRPNAWVINEALAAYFERENQQQRMYRETLEGLADVEAGRLIDGEQVMAWIESWGACTSLWQRKIKRLRIEFVTNCWMVSGRFSSSP